MGISIIERKGSGISILERKGWGVSMHVTDKRLIGDRSKWALLLEAILLRTHTRAHILARILLKLSHAATLVVHGWPVSISTAMQF